MVNETYGVAKLSDAFYIFVQDDRLKAPPGTYYMARWMFLEAGNYTIKAYGDDSFKIAVSGSVVAQRQTYFPVEDSKPAQGNFSVGVRGAVRFDAEYTEAEGRVTAAFLVFAVYDDKGSLVYASRGEHWSGATEPLDDEDLDPRGAIDPAVDERLSMPVWLLRPNWANGVEETHAFLTDVMVSEADVEQRVGLRRFPRWSWACFFDAFDVKSSALHAALTGQGWNKWLAPIPWSGTRLDSPIVEGSTSLFGDWTGLSYRENDALVIRDMAALHVYEVGLVSEVSDGELVLKSPVQRTWRAGAMVERCKVARIVQDTTANVQTAGVSSANVLFSVHEVERVDFGSFLDEFPRHPLDNDLILDIRHNWAEGTTTRIDRQVFVQDNQTGIRSYFDVGGQSRQTFAYRWLTVGREGLLRYRAVVHYLRGRQTAAWVPSLTADILLNRDVEAGDGEINVIPTGFAQYGTTGQRIKQNIVFKLKDGTWLYNQVVSARIRDEEEVLTLADTFPRGYSTGDFARVFFIAKGRLADDDVVTHHDMSNNGWRHTALTFEQIQNRWE